MRIDFKELVPYIDISRFSEGLFNINVDLPDGRSVNLIGRLNINGRRVHNYNDPDDEGYFLGNADFSLSDWTGYDPKGNVIPVIGSTWFENRMQTLINQSL